MQLAYLTTQPVGTKDPAGVRRWRKLLNSKPDKFLAIMEAQEKRFEASQKEAKGHAAEFERLSILVPRLQADLTEARNRIAELVAQLGSESDDEYADPAIERLEELRTKLAMSFNGPVEG